MKTTFWLILITIFILTGCSGSQDMDYISIKSDSAEAAQESHPEMEALERINEDTVTIAFASVVSPEETSSKYELLVNHIQEELDQPVHIVRKQTYDEVNQLLETGEVDIGFICSLSYVLGREQGYIEGIATPVVDGQDVYRSYLIVNKNTDIHAIDDLKDKRFAYMDPYSYSGRLAMLDMLHQNGFDPDTFFKKTFFTYSHDYSISAVAKGAVDGASVDSILFDLMVENEHPYTEEIRIIEKGTYAGAPPVVVSSKIDPDLKELFTEKLLSLHQSPEGQHILNSIQIDAYTELKPADYDPIAEIVNTIGDFR
ncbi:substrate-binding domain-containing protein [Salisediminibacterium selenitireducens]|uniref:Phosphonate ABC transporter, periplasmic phosphonate-binding protein n=1 Tax=Bacillus selenitireducens (strain ATCC 700615 / DSM 15326 / MLS10) TaxID=439292 RepID=D6XXR5_BACIE|nr:phosphate/phosphite/phosphonate ABC transporter substrate-binding protein [Salisediminibacterium selenitireducens]ADI00108.1 phosphonate ABC transporter, periplasmic phosphonate-binding protein [[Bacillus] selenitireducens MLS10]